MKRRSFAVALILGQTAFSALVGRAEEVSNTPYIDQLREKIRAKDEEEGKVPENHPGEVEPYIDSLRQKMASPPEEASGSVQPYIDHLRESDPEKFANPGPGASFTEEQRRLLPPKEEGGAIQALREGRSELKMKRPGQINGAFGFKVGSIVSRSITGSGASVYQPFENVYGGGYRPDFTFYGEYQPFHSETLGSLGFIGSIGFSTYKGSGVFAVSNLTRPDGTPFPPQSLTEFRFYAIPATVGADYRFNWGKYIRPFASLSPTLISYFETRNDNVSGNHGKSYGVTFSAGACILADWISHDATWNLYQDYGIKHLYFTVEYQKLSTISSDVDFSFSGLSAGVGFEF